MFFSVVNAVAPLEREEFGLVVFVQKRLLFRIFSPSPARAFYKPSFAGAGFHEINLEKVRADKFARLNEFLALDDAYAAMSFLRKNDLILDKHNH
jgi:hypothetical protein